MPPITTVARGRCTSAPIPVARAMGTNPREATKAVISTGRSRVSDPCRMASSKGTSWSRNLLIKEMMTIPFNTATPDNAMNPTAAEIDNGIPRIHKEKTPPVKAKGIPVNTKKEFLMEPKAANSSKKISKREAGMTSHNRLAAEIKDSN